MASRSTNTLEEFLQKLGEQTTAAKFLPDSAPFIQDIIGIETSIIQLHSKVLSGQHQQALGGMPGGGMAPPPQGMPAGVPAGPPPGANGPGIPRPGAAMAAGGAAEDLRAALGAAGGA